MGGKAPPKSSPVGRTLKKSNATAAKVSPYRATVYPQVLPFGKAMTRRVYRFVEND